MPNPKCQPSPKSLVDAAQRADVTALTSLVAQGGDLNALYRGYRGLHALIQTKPHADATAPSTPQLQCFEWMLANGANPDLPAAWPPARAILTAAFTGSSEYVAMLAPKKSPDLFIAAALGDVTVVRREIARDAKAAEARDVGGLTALQCAAGSRMWRQDERTATRLVEIATVLLDAGADPHAPTESWSHDIDAVYLAASSHHVALFALLLERGADATHAVTPALWNGGKDFATLAEIALKHGADVNRAEAGNRPLLHDLIRWGQFQPAFWLLAHGADPNRRQGMDGTPNAGWTAVHQAASRGNAKMLQAVLDAGGDPAIKDAVGRTPADVARMGAMKNVFRAQGKGQKA